MTNFKTSGIVLKIINNQKINTIYIFSKEYWKIICSIKNNKKEKMLDIWNIVNFEISTKNNFNNIKNITIINSINYNILNYNTIYEYLTLINYIFKLCPLNEVNTMVYDIVFEINKYKSISQEKIIFAQLKLLDILWYWIENKTIKKLNQYISKNNIKNILRLKWLNENQLINLKKEIDLVISNRN